MTSVLCEIRDRRIAIRWERRFPGDNTMAKSVPGYRWDKQNLLWHYPLTLTTCRLLREVYTDMLVIGPALTQWAQREIAWTRERERLGAAEDAPLELVPNVLPKLHEATSKRRYQRAGIRWLATNGKGAMLADEPTLGKTIQYLGAIAEAGLDSGLHLVIAPRNSLYSTWAHEIHKWTPWHAFWMPDGRDKRERVLELFGADQYEGPKFLVVNFAMLQIQMKPWCNKCKMWGPSKKEERERQKNQKTWWPLEHYTSAHSTSPRIFKCPWPQLFDIEWTSICIDEAHQSLLGVKNLHISEKNTQEGNGLLSLRSKPGGMRIGSTGTPIHGHAMNFWSFFHWLDPETYKSKWQFAESFLEIKENGFGKTIGDIDPHREHLLSEALSSIMLRRTKREVQPDLPEDLYIDHEAIMRDQHLRQYNDLVLEGELEIAGGSLSTQGVLAEYTRRKQFAFGAWRALGGKMTPATGQSAKAELLYELLAKRGVTAQGKDDFRLEGGWKYIVGSQFTRILDFLEEEMQQMDIPTLKITGSVSGKRRDAAVTAWQKDTSPGAARVLFVNTIAGGTSLTLDAMCDEMFILDETWVYDEQFQLEGRIRNRDVEKRVAVRSYHYIRTKDTLEEEIHKSGLKQEEFQKRILDTHRKSNK